MSEAREAGIPELSSSPAGSDTRDVLRHVALRSKAGVIAAAMIIAWITWPHATQAGQVGQDPSWMAGLHLAADQGLLFGADVAYTYGPLGFLGLPQPYFGGTSALALGFAVVVHGGIALLVLAALREAMPLWVALSDALIVTRLDGYMLAWDATVPLAVLIAAAVVLGRRRLDRFPLAPIALGLLAGPALLGKLNVGLIVFAVLGVAVAGSVPRARLGAGLLGYVMLTALSFVAAWLATGQSLPFMLPWVMASVDIILGYTSAMATELGPDDTWMLLMAILGLGVLAWAWIAATTSQPPRQRILLLIMIAGVGIMTAKSGLVRADHQTQLMATLPLLVVPVGAIVGRGHRALILGALLLLFVTVGLASSGSLPEVPGYPQDLVAQVAVIATPGKQVAATEATAATMRSAYALDTRALDLMKNLTVHVEPMEAGIAFAYPEIRWRPVPVFQEYQAYTASLDTLNADSLAAARAPGLRGLSWRALVRRPPSAGSLRHRRSRRIGPAGPGSARGAARRCHAALRPLSWL